MGTLCLRLGKEGGDKHWQALISFAPYNSSMSRSEYYNTEQETEDRRGRNVSRAAWLQRAAQMRLNPVTAWEGPVCGVGRGTRLMREGLAPREAGRN